jgi:hypothetical protein
VALAADTEDEAWALFQSRARWRMDRQFGRIGPILPPDQARDYTPSEQVALAEMRANAFVGSGPQVADKLRALAERLQVDEVVLITWTHDPAARSPLDMNCWRVNSRSADNSQQLTRSFTMFSTAIAGSLPKPEWLAETNKLWPKWHAEGRCPALKPRPMPRCCGSKPEEDAGLDVIGDGEQSRQHFVHGFLEQVEGIDFENKVTMGIRNNRYDAQVPQVIAPLRLKGRVHAFEAQLARAHTQKKLKFTLPGPMTIVDTVADRFYGEGEEGRIKMAVCLCRVVEPGGLGFASRWRGHHPV